MKRYAISMATSGKQLAGRNIRYVTFQNADGTYPTNAHEVTDETLALCYSTSGKDRRGYIGSYLVGNIPAIASEIDQRRKGTAWMVATPAEANSEAEPAPTSRRGRLADDQLAYLALSKPERTAAWNGADIERRGRCMAAEIIRDSDEEEAYGMDAEADKRRGLLGAMRHDGGGTCLRNNCPGCVSTCESDCEGDCDGDCSIKVAEVVTGLADRLDHMAEQGATIAELDRERAMSAEETKAAQLAYLRSIPGRMPNCNCSTLGHADDCPAKVDPRTLTADDPRNGDVVDLDRLDRLMRHRDHGHDVLNDAVMEACEIDGPPTPEPTPDTRHMAKTMWIGGNDTWTPEHCHHIPPLNGCWCAVNGSTFGDLEIIDETPSLPVWSEGMCWAVESLCYSTGVTRLACCGLLLCSSHARQAADDVCPNCGLMMSAPLAAFDAAEQALRDNEALTVATGGDLAAPDWTSDSWVSDGYALSVQRPDVPASRPVWPRYGVTVEWWDDEAGCSRQGVIGSYDTWEIAVAEMARLKRVDRFDRVTGTIALYGSLEDF